MFLLDFLKQYVKYRFIQKERVERHVDSEGKGNDFVAKIRNKVNTHKVRKCYVI